jgi:hypothetical protein
MFRILTSPSGSSDYNVLYSENNIYENGGIYDEDEGSLSTTDDLYFKTKTHYAGITPVIAVTEDLDTMKTLVDTTVENYAKAPAVSSVTEGARPIYIYIEGKIVLMSGYTLAGVSALIYNNLIDYINTMDIGDDIIWSKIHFVIMATEGVSDIKDLKTKHKKITDVDFIQDSIYEDVIIDDREVANLIGVNFELYGV